MSDIRNSDEFKQWAAGLKAGMEDSARAPHLDCPSCKRQMMHVVGYKLAGYRCQGSFGCVGIDLTVEDLCDSELYKIKVADCLDRQKRYDDMRSRNGVVADPTPEQRRALKFCGTCHGYHPPNPEHPLCSECSFGIHAPASEDMFFDFKGWRFRAPFHCMCCGAKVCFTQWAFGRSCGTCDTGRCNSDHLHPRSMKIFCGPNTELIDPTEAERYNFTPERMAPIPPNEPLKWRERDSKRNLYGTPERVF